MTAATIEWPVIQPAKFPDNTHALRMARVAANGACEPLVEVVTHPEYGECDCEGTPDRPCVHYFREVAKAARFAHDDLAIAYYSIADAGAADDLLGQCIMLADAISGVALTGAAVAENRAEVLALADNEPRGPWGYASALTALAYLLRDQTARDHFSAERT